ncbi:MAG: C1 family peptidase [Candidatus Erginobacter occultus]|nr:C1 family peptidase [Candidatus Erginobacter occultus]
MRRRALANAFIFLSLLLPPASAVGDDILPFEPDDTLEEIRYKIDYNGYLFEVEDTWVFRMDPEEKSRFLSRRPPREPKALTASDEIGPLAKHLSKRALPSSFDWRDFDGRSYIGPVRNQGDCGSCYAFGAAASAEGTYNYAMNLYDGNCIDLSESYIIWCLGRLPQYNGDFFGCDGASYAYAELDALVEVGVGFEADFPYQETDPGSCTHWSDQTIAFESWHRVPCNNIEAIKTAIMTYGVVDAAVYVGSAFQGYSGGIYDDSNTTCDASPCYNATTNHAIALIGWDDNPPEGGDGVWILRNSWGVSWGEGGYMRIRYTAARVSCAVCYLVYQEPATPTPTPFGFLTPSPTPTASVTPAGYKTPSPVPTATAAPTPSPTPQGLQVFLAEDFEGSWPGWTEEHITGSEQWWQGEGCGDPGGIPPAAYQGTYNALFYYDDYETRSTRLVSPQIQFPDGVANPTLTFWHTQGDWEGDWDTMIVYYRTSSGGSWQQLASYQSPVDAWTERNLTLPQASDDYYISFVPRTGYGWGVCIDALQVKGTAGATPIPPPAPSPTCGPPLPRPGSLIAGGDYDGDGLSDIAVFRPAAGLWAVRGITRAYFGRAGDLPVPGDYAGGGRDEIAIFRFSSGLWAVKGVTRAYFGKAGDFPVPGDYQGDGIDRIAIFRPGTGLWVVRGITRAYFGKAGDLPVPAAYSAAGNSEISVFRPSSGLWAIRGVSRIYFGGGDDWPVPGDYGLGLASPAVFRPAAGLWAVRGLTRAYFGGSLDYPVPGGYSGSGFSGWGIFRPAAGLWALRGITRVYFGDGGDIPATR